MASHDTLKILCIHGYRQNKDSFREKLGAFRKLIKKHAELVFVDAPNRVPPILSDQTVANESSEDVQLGWWFSKESDSFHAQEETDICKGFEKSLATIEKTFEDSGPFDGLLGFSQGAAMVGLLCGLQQHKKWSYHFDFAIMIAGFKSRSAPHHYLYESTITIPTLHVFGDSDKVIFKDMSEEFLQYFHEPEVHCHSGGHYVPAAGPQKKIYSDFLLEMLKRRKG